MDTFKPRWTSASILLYAGGLTVLLVALESTGYLSAAYGDGALAGWVALMLAVLAAIAFAFRARGRWIAAGVFAVAAVVAVAVFVGALEQWWGWLPRDRSGPFTGFNVPVLLLELVMLVAALVAARLFRFPFLGAPIAGTAWFFVTDLVSGGGDWSAVVTFLVGLAFLLLGVRLDHGVRSPYAFWFHLAAGLTIGGSFLFFWHRSDANWALVAVAALVYVAIAAVTRRSSWAVLAAIGLFLSGSHFASEWSSFDIAGIFGDGGRTRGWPALLVFAFVGFLLVALGLLVARGRDADGSSVAGTAAAP